MTDLDLEVNLPKTITSLRQLKTHMWREYHVDIDIDSNSDNYENIFYNEDLRSMCGFIEEFGNIHLFPEYYSVFCSAEYQKLLANSKRVGCSYG